MKYKILIVLLIAWRLWVSTFTKHGDLHNGWNWAGNASKLGLVDFYDLPRSVFWPQSRPNQPAGSVYLYTLSYQLNDFGNKLFWQLNLKIPFFPSTLVWWWQRWGDVVSLKLPSVLGDIALFAAIIKIGKSSKVSQLVGLVYLLNPPLWYNSALWGQNDCIVAALAVWSLIFLFEKRLVLSGFLLGTSLVTKASWSPALIVFTIYAIRKFPKNFWTYLASVGASSLLLFFPFHPRLDLPFWLTKLYLNRILPGESPFITVNAFNFWHVFFPIDLVPDTSLFLTIPANIISVFLLLLIFAVTLRSIWKNPSEHNLVSQLLIVYFGFFLFSVRMHERYMYPLFPLMSWLIVIGRKIWIQYAVLSFTFLANQYNMWFAPTMPFAIALYTPIFTKALSVINLFTWFTLWPKKSSS
ncbi:hypothetical protein A3D85_01900 [Candidatus Amesbacteria bacterium RIFCSPHIGHO2_02_FULL_47_9]|uniref:Glycosyltransferase RgtA/B/C/D-like domain-containing protein n=1 Tax=Candidatus Amesbacteria bacterium RIFCSPHIGHO2_01_FULL_48_32b TaxID=1797253 RepID=A0A1F4YEH0_9BACT|nr:MAG: hypothetical protein A2876_02620 [Candidatus Amesbacteria bacterium RIFCSPHIGHO2_01_FULL_48_32b]OGD04520.1 MAG: hypothetical protein A3D85_01900 [Candidatus Amesbacteria bacterium RIFCSPHIGHO2_02_FULL_47_9]OGD08110.1 MAG: hypothetical protein A2899_02065 [Candidatus Amesbacteria bacterium RIFCSPLOWO2_01_FULL_49_25]